MKLSNKLPPSVERSSKYGKMQMLARYALMALWPDGCQLLKHSALLMPLLYIFGCVS